MGCGHVRLLRTIGGLDVTGQERAALNKLTMPEAPLGDPQAHEPCPRDRGGQVPLPPVETRPLAAPRRRLPGAPGRRPQCSLKLDHTRCALRNWHGPCGRLGMGSTRGAARFPAGRCRPASRSCAVAGSRGNMLSWETRREPAYDRAGRCRWSAAIRCQNSGDGVRFRASHW